MREQDGTQNTTLKQVPVPYDDDDVRSWKESKEFWKSQGQPWRLMPEIDEERQKFLAERRSITPNREQGIYPFKDIKLSRADIEWLLATHENGRGPIDWSDESQRERYGLDVRGADLCNENLAYLPLACVGRVESEIEEVFDITFHNERNDAATIHLEGALFYNSHLERADFTNSNLEKAALNNAHLEGAVFNQANLKGAEIVNANLKKAFFWDAHLEGANLGEAHLEGAIIKNTHLEGANIQGAFFDSLTLLNESAFGDTEYGAVALADVHWGDVNVAVVNWSTISVLGDEVEAKKRRTRYGREKHEYDHFLDYLTAVRAYRQLSIVLRNQGLNEDAARFAFRAQRMQRKVFLLQRKFGQYLFSSFLNLLAGYGYRFWRSLFAYAFVIIVFAAIYYHLGPHLLWYESIVISMTAFHGRGFFQTQFNPGDPQAIAAAIEAVVGLFIEITLIATLTQRLFGK